MLAPSILRLSYAQLDLRHGALHTCSLAVVQRMAVTVKTLTVWYQNSKYSISEYQGNKLRDKGLPTKEITGAKFRFYQGYLWNQDFVDLDYYLDHQEHRERPFKEVYRPGAKDTQRKFGFFYSLAEIKNRIQTVKEEV